MRDYLSDIWRCRYFWLSLVRSDLRTRYRRSILGMGWSLLNPIAMTIILTLVFSTWMGAGLKDPFQYALTVLAGLACWNYIRVVALQGCVCLYLGESYIRQYPAPMAIYPLRIALGETVHFLIALGVVIATSWYFNGFANIHSLPILIPSVVLLFIFGWAVATLMGFATVHFHDTQHLSEIGFQILFYATPIMYSEEFLHGRWIWAFLRYNPIRYLLKLVREPILEGGSIPSLTTYVIACGIVAMAVAFAGVILSRLQRRLIFHL